MTHICVSDLTSIGSDNGMSPGRRQAIIRTNAGILLIRPLGTNFSEFSVEILIFSFKKMRLKVSSKKRRPFCLGLNELISAQTKLPMHLPLSELNVWFEFNRISSFKITFSDILPNFPSLKPSVNNCHVCYPELMTRRRKLIMITTIVLTKTAYYYFNYWCCSF